MSFATCFPNLESRGHVDELRRMDNTQFKPPRRPVNTNESSSTAQQHDAQNTQIDLTQSSASITRKKYPGLDSDSDDDDAQRWGMEDDKRPVEPVFRFDLPLGLQLWAHNCPLLRQRRPHAYP